MISTTYDRYKKALQRVADVQYSAAVMEWDQETYIPSKGTGFRGQQIATLMGIAHELFTERNLDDLAYELKDDETLSDEERKNVLLTLKDLVREKKLSKAFVEKLSLAQNKAFHAWHKLKKQMIFPSSLGHWKKW